MAKYFAPIRTAERLAPFCSCPSTTSKEKRSSYAKSLLAFRRFGAGSGGLIGRFRRSNEDAGKLQSRSSRADPRFVWRLGESRWRRRRRLYHFRSRRQKGRNTARRYAVSALGTGQAKFRKTRKRTPRDF